MDRDLPCTNIIFLKIVQDYILRGSAKHFAALYVPSLYIPLIEIFFLCPEPMQKDMLCQVSSIIVSLVRPAQALWPEGIRKQTRDGGGGGGVMI